MTNADGLQRLADFHNREASRLQAELDSLDDQFALHGIMRSVLRVRIVQERLLANEAEIASDTHKCLAEVLEQC